MFLFGQIDDAVLGQLVDLAFDHPQRDIAQQANDIERVLRQRHRHRLDVEEVACQHRDIVAPLRVDGLAAAAHVGVIDDVVVHQRRGVDELDHGGIEHGARAGITAEARAHQQYGRADALAAALQYVVADFGNDVNLRLDLARKFDFDSFKILADRLEQLDEVRGGPGCGVGHVRRSHHTDRAVSTLRSRLTLYDTKPCSFYGLKSRSKLRSVSAAMTSAPTLRTAASCSTTFAT